MADRIVLEDNDFKKSQADERLHVEDLAMFGKKLMNYLKDGTLGNACLARVLFVV